MAAQKEFLNHRSPKHRQIYEAVWRGWENSFETLVKEDAPLDHRYFNDRTLIHLAAYFGHVNIVRRLLELGVDFDVKDAFGKTPQILAAENNQPYIAGIFEQFKTDPQAALTSPIPEEVYAQFSLDAQEETPSKQPAKKSSKPSPKKSP